MSNAPDITEAPDATSTLKMARNFAVKVEQLFAAWTDPEQACQWMGPHNVDCRIDRWNFQEGGNYEMAENHSGGWQGALACLEEYLAE